MRHKSYQEWLRLSICDELSHEQMRLLEEHLHSCPQCRSEIEALRRMKNTVSEYFPIEATQGMLEDARRTLRSTFERRLKPYPVFDRLFYPLYRVVFAAVAVLAAGFLLGYGAFSLIGTRAVPQSPTAQAKQPQGRIENLQFVDPPPGGWVNASAADQDVEFTFDLVNQIRMKGKLHDTAIQKILAMALVNEQNSGIRLESVAAISTFRPDTPDPAIRKALIDTMVHDENPGVRLQAMEALKIYPYHNSIKEAFLQVLLNDKLPGLRIQAINALMASPMRAHSTDPEIRHVFKEKLVNDENSYIRLQARQFIKENAL